jgi:hypothetical protein
VAPECSGEEFRECARELALARPMMAATQNAVASAWSRYLDTGNAADAVDDVIETFRRRSMDRGRPAAPYRRKR